MAAGAYLSACVDAIGRQPLAVSDNLTTSMPFGIRQLLGLEQGHLLPKPWPECVTVPMHPEAAQAFTKLCVAARRDGFELRAISGFRSFAHQQRIWDAKASGSRTVFDEQGRALDISGIEDAAKVRAILRWSALPGASRHHWGSDVDVYDAAAVPAGYSVQLSASEARETFGELHRWFDQQQSQGQSYGFYRPYDGRGGIAAELWHWSYAPVAGPFSRSLTEAALRDCIHSSNIRLRATVLEMLGEIYANNIEPYRT